jgi:hypothetical protein
VSSSRKSKPVPKVASLPQAQVLEGEAAGVGQVAPDRVVEAVGDEGDLQLGAVRGEAGALEADSAAHVEREHAEPVVAALAVAVHAVVEHFAGEAGDRGVEVVTVAAARLGDRVAVPILVVVAAAVAALIDVVVPDLGGAGVDGGVGVVAVVAADMVGEVAVPVLVVVAVARAVAVLAVVPGVFGAGMDGVVEVVAVDIAVVAVAVDIPSVVLVGVVGVAAGVGVQGAGVDVPLLRLLGFVLRIGALARRQDEEEGHGQTWASAHGSSVAGCGRIVRRGGRSAPDRSRRAGRAAASGGRCPSPRTGTTRAPGSARGKRRGSRVGLRTCAAARRRCGPRRCPTA